MLKQATKKIFVFFIFLIIIIGILIFYQSKNKESEKTIQFVGGEAFVNSFSAVKQIDNGKDPEFKISDITNIRKKEAFDSKLREKILELSPSPLKPVPVSQMLTKQEEIDRGSYKEKKIAILTSNSTIAFAYILIPKNVALPAPAIIVMHQHGGTKYGIEEVVGKIGDENMFFGKELAERGYVVFAMDAASFGSRSDFTNDSFDVREKRRAQELLVLGYSPMGIIIQEDLTSLNFLYSLSDVVDKNNIGCIGHSFGGTRCMYLSALDERIKVTVLSNSVGKFKKDLDSGSTQTLLSILPSIAKYTDFDGLLALIAPRHLLVVYSEKDPINFIGYVEEQISEIPNIYKIYNKRDNFNSAVLINTTHEFPKEYHKEVYNFFDKHLKN